MAKNPENAILLKKNKIIESKISHMLYKSSENNNQSVPTTVIDDSTASSSSSSINTNSSSVIIFHDLQHANSTGESKDDEEKRVKEKVEKIDLFTHY